MREPTVLHRQLLRAAAVVACAVVSNAASAAPLRAQFAAPTANTANTTCDYQACAFGLQGKLHGLVVTRGADETPVATLGFLFTRDISRHFNEAARSEAQAAVRTRRIAMVLTDVGLGLLIAGVADAAGSDDGSGRYVDTGAARLMIAGAATIGVSVPLQFKADTHLARAIWRHNAVYAQGAR